MARIVLCPEFEYFTQLSPAMRRAMDFACTHGSSACVLLEAVGGKAGEEAACAFLDALWSTDPDPSEVLAAIERMMAVMNSVSSDFRMVGPTPHLEHEEIGPGLRWLGARLYELERALS
jgi:hypothetical protein